MTATSYTVLDSDDLGANKILRAATMSALDSNPVAIAQRGTDAPWLNGVGAITVYTSGSGTFTVPSGVFRILVKAVGGGASNHASGGGSAANGNDTTFGSLTASKGLATGAGGSASGGDINITGISGVVGGLDATAGIFGGSIGSGASGNVTSGGAGGAVIKIFSVEPGDTFSYSVGAGGVGTGANTSGGNGIITIEY